MSRIIKCGLIQAHNVAPTDAPIEEIKKANIVNLLIIFVPKSAQLKYAIYKFPDLIHEFR